MPNGNNPTSNAPGPDLDTGTGGFPVGKNNTRVTYDVGTEDDSPVDRTQWSPGQVRVDNRKRDISRSTKSTLASYLSDTTLGKTSSSPNGAKNKYPINQIDGSDPVEIRLTDTDGYSSNPDTSLGSYASENKFVENDKLPSMKSRSMSATNLDIVRGRQNPNGKSGIDGNTLLKDVTKDGLESNPQQQATSVPGNGFSPPTSVAVNEGSPVKNYYGNPNVSNSVIFNRFNPEENQYGEANTLKNDQFSSKYSMGTSNAVRNISFGKLAQIGNALSTRAGLELESIGLGIPRTNVDLRGDPSGPVASAAALLPGAAQLGAARIERERLTAKSVLDELITDPIQDNVLIDPLGKSWGSLNNVLDEYSGMSNIGMQLLAAALVASLTSIFSALSFLFSTVFTGTNETGLIVIDSETMRRPYGAYAYDENGKGNYNTIAALIDQIRSGKFNFWRMIGIQSTRHPLDRCLAAGSLAFFGINSPNSTLSTVDGEAKSKSDTAVTQSPGYYAVMARSVNRSFLQIGDAFQRMFSAFGGIDIANGVKQIFSLIETLRDSKFMKTISIFANLGDQVIEINSASKQYVYDESSVGPGVRFISRIDLAPENSAGKSRLGGPASMTNTLAWSSYRARDLLIMPSAFGTGFTSLDSVPKGPTLGVPDLKSNIPPSKMPGGVSSFNTPANSGLRISAEDRESLESYLEGEYVPFYLHDVRTNEIISFHAFLTSLSDDYTTNYDSVEAFGRVDPIRVYKSTVRRIGFSFVIAATSKNDFDVMWLKINKLVTMVYPQFSEGRRLVGDGYSIYAPFSQSISASPLIRVRIGDLLQSNYSKFNLARIFGYTYNNTKIPSPSPTPQPAPNSGPTYNEKVESFNKIEQMLKPGFTFTSSAPLSKQIIKKNDKLTNSQIVSTDPSLTLPRGYVLKVVSRVEVGPNPGAECRVVKARGDDKRNMTGILSYDEWSGGGGSAKHIEDKVYFFNGYELTPTISTQNSLEALKRQYGNNLPSGALTTSTAPAATQGTAGSLAETTNAGEQTLANVKDFMTDNESSKGNAIARSFRSSGGKGLAGFIDSINFDWYDNVTWTTDEGEGRKAPKMCKITVAFSPIHDITPGLDHTGFNRAPVYPVGPMSIPRKT